MGHPLEQRREIRRRRGQSPRQVILNTRGAFLGDTGAIIPTQIQPHQQTDTVNTNYWVFNEHVTLYSTGEIGWFFSRNDANGAIATDFSAGIRWTLVGHLVEL